MGVQRGRQREFKEGKRNTARKGREEKSGFL